MTATHYSREEAVRRVAALTQDEWRKTFIYAQFLLKRSKEKLAFEELVDEAVARTLEGRRQWKIGMDGPSHFFGAMKSILNSWNRSAAFRQSVIINISAMIPETDYSFGDGHDELVERISEAAEGLITDGNLNEHEEQVLSALLSGEPTDSILHELGLGVDEYKHTVAVLVGKIGDDA